MADEVKEKGNHDYAREWGREAMRYMAHASLTFDEYKRAARRIVPRERWEEYCRRAERDAVFSASRAAHWARDASS